MLAAIDGNIEVIRTSDCLIGNHSLYLVLLLIPPHMYVADRSSPHTQPHIQGFVADAGIFSKWDTSNTRVVGDTIMLIIK